DVAAAGRDDAGSHGAAEAERIADRDNPVTDANLGVVGEVDVGELVGAVDLEHGEVGLGVGADQLGIELPAVIGHDREGLAAVDDVVVGDEVAVLGDEEAGALRNGARLLLAVAAAHVELAAIAVAIIAAEVLEELLERIRQVVLIAA